MLAFLDESQSNQSLDPDTYILAAGVCDHPSAEAARPIMSGLRLKGQVKLHWHDESEARRRRISEAIAEVPVRHLVVVRTGFNEDRPERQRRHCLERMLYELDQLQVSEATFESRGPKSDLNDRWMLDALRSRACRVADAADGSRSGTHRTTAVDSGRGVRSGRSRPHR
jgi:hypothetical protein